jgi:hypothetical protein
MTGDRLMDGDDIDGFLANIYKDVQMADFKDVISKENLDQRNPILMDGRYSSLRKRASILTIIYSSKSTTVECVQFDVSFPTHDIRGASNSDRD